MVGGPGRRPMPLSLVSLFGILALLGICYLLSHDRAAISWRLVGTGLLIQVALGGLLLYWRAGNEEFRRLGAGVKSFLDLSQEGNRVVFGLLADEEVLASVFPGQLTFIIATQVLPTLIFFSSFMAVLYHLGVMQRIVKWLAWVTARVMGTSGAESLSACGNVFVGQTEAPLMVRPFLRGMTESELHTVMTGGFATIAGGVFVIYVGMGVEAGHLIVASVMAVPAGLICSKMLWPETGRSETMGKVVDVHMERHANVVEAAAVGATDGLKLALNVGAMLVAFLGLVAVLDWILGTAGGWAGLELSVGRILGWLFFPVAAVLGVQDDEIQEVARLLGTKIALTELVAYRDLTAMKETLSPRTFTIASFALCGFANLGSVAVQVGGLGAMAPERRPDVARLALRAMMAGALATCMTACVAGLML